MIKRFITSLFCLFLIFASIPFIGGTQFLCPFVYADSVPDGYSPCGLNDQVDAFKSYCQSRNLVVEGSGLDVVTAFTTNAYQGAVRKVGLDINQLQNEIYKRTKDNLGAKWFFTQTGIAAYNRIFAEFLQNNDLEAGDTDVDKNVYSGDLYTDPSGNSALVYYLNATSQQGTGSWFSSDFSNYIVKFGTSYCFDKSQYSNLNSVTIPFQNNNYTIPIVHNGTGYYYTGSFYDTANDSFCYNITNLTSNASNRTIVKNGGDIAIIKLNDNKYYCGYVAYNTCKLSDGRYVSSFGYKTYYGVSTASQAITQNVTVNIVSNEINNNTYEGDTYITNEGDIYNPPVETPPGGSNPGWDVGGGQGSYEDNSGNSYTINFPDFELPDLNIDWSIQGLGNKFPFSIPFDIVSLVTVLNAEPEAPRFQGTVNFGFTTWDYDINLQQFDNVAQVCRIAELLLLVFGLILITRSIIKG